MARVKPTFGVIILVNGQGTISQTGTKNKNKKNKDKLSLVAKKIWAQTNRRSDKYKRRQTIKLTKIKIKTDVKSVSEDVFSEALLLKICHRAHIQFFTVKIHIERILIKG